MNEIIQKIKDCHYQTDIENSLLFLEAIEFADKNIRPEEAKEFYPYLLNYADDNLFYRLICVERLLSCAQLNAKEQKKLFNMTRNLKRRIYERYPKLVENMVYRQELAVIAERQACYLDSIGDSKAAAKVLNEAMNQVKGTALEEKYLEILQNRQRELEEKSNQ